MSFEDIGQRGISIVVPAYNEATRIVGTLRSIKEYCSAKLPEHEILVVDDGSKDHTARLARDALGEDPRYRVLVLDRNRGKGYAVKHGVMSSRHPFVLFSDADLSTPVQELEKLAVYAGDDVAVIASRGLPDSEIVMRQPRYRETMGKVFNLAVRLLVAPGIRDTQCGFKLFGQQVVQDIFPILRTDRFAFDVEIVALCLRRGFRVVEVPVRWYNDSRSRVNPVKDSAVMLKDLVKVWWRVRNA